MAEALRRLPALKRLEQRDTVPMTYRQYTGVFAASIPRHVRLFMEKQLRNDKPDNIFTSSRALNSKHVLPVSFLAVLPRYISRYNAPSAASLGAFATCYRSAIERLLIYISNTRGRRGNLFKKTAACMKTAACGGSTLMTSHKWLCVIQGEETRYRYGMQFDLAGLNGPRRRSRSLS